MTTLLETLTQQLDAQRIGAIARQLGADPAQTQAAINAALPTLLGAAGRNAADPQNAQQMHQALQRDHDGSLLDQLGGLLGGDDAENGGSSALVGQGSRILGHLLGGRQTRVESGVSQASGLDAGQASKLMAMLAPMLMGALGKKQREEALSPEDMGQMLQRERQQSEASVAGGSSFIGKMLDQDGDGDFDASDVMKFGMNKLFGRKS